MLPSAHAIAWARLNNNVRLQVMPSSFSSTLAASMPSHVDAILINIRDLSIPTSLYNEIILRAFAIVASLSKDNLASTSVETYPGTILVISAPKLTANLSFSRN